MSNFNKEQFAQLLKRAQGKRSLNQFALNSGVDSGYLSRFINLKRDNPPSPEVLQKIANAAYNDVTYESLMKIAGYLKEYRNIDKDALEDNDFNRILPVILKHLNDSILKHGHNESKELLDKLDLTRAWKYLDDDEKIKLFNLVIKEAKYNKTTNKFSLTQYFIPDEEGYKIFRDDFLRYVAEDALDIDSLESFKSSKEKYEDVHDIEEAMKIILEQPGLMLKGEILSDESKIILANAIQMGLRTAEELEKKKGDNNE